MKILYAPCKRDYEHNDLYGNVACSFDCIVIETLLDLGHEVLYYPQKGTFKKVVDSIRDVFGNSIKYPKNPPKDAEIVVSDGSALIFKYALITENPGILCLFSFNGIDLPQDNAYYSLVDCITHKVFSLKEFKELMLNYNNASAPKRAKLQEFFESEIL